MSSGAKVVSAYAKQSDVKTTPKTGWKILPNIKNGLTMSTTLTESEMLGGGRVPRQGLVTGAQVSGDVEVELEYGVFDDFLAAAFWNDWQTGTPDTLTVGSTKHQFAIAKDFSDINVNHLFKGCVVNSLTLSVSTDGYAKTSFGLMGIGYEESNTKSFASNPTPAPIGKKASTLSVGIIKIDGADIGVCVEAFEFSIDNGAEIQKCLGNNLYGGNILAMLASMTGKLTLAYSQEAHNLIKEQLTGRTFSLEFPIEFETNRKYVLKIPKMQVSGEIPSPSGKELATVDVNFSVVDESPVLEKHKA